MRTKIDGCKCGNVKKKKTLKYIENSPCITKVGGQWREREGAEREKKNTNPPASLRLITAQVNEVCLCQGVCGVGRGSMRVAVKVNE